MQINSNMQNRDEKPNKMRFHTKQTSRLYKPPNREEKLAGSSAFLSANILRGF